MVMVDHQIKKAINSGHLKITNFSEESVQPASYDLRIGSYVYSPSSENPDKPINLSSNGGIYRLPPYGTAVVMTHETLELPNDIIGRFGLKSGFARKGLIASTGPQVDPGYKGKLIVSLMNLVPRSQIISFLETFLTIEFNTLEISPTKCYSGPYQSLEDISPDILDDMMRLEGLNLSQLQSQFTKLAQHVKEWSEFSKRFDEFINVMTEQTSAFREFTQNISKKIDIRQEEEILETKELSLKDAKAEIINLFKYNPQMYYSDIADELNVDYSLVVRACDELLKEDMIEGIEEKGEQE